MKENFQEDKENKPKESEELDSEKKFENLEENNEIEKNQNELLFNPMEQMSPQDFEIEYSTNKIINYVLYIVPEVLFITSFFLTFFYKVNFRFFFVPYLIPIVLFNFVFFIAKKLFYLKIYFLISKLSSIEILIFYPIFMIKQNFYEKNNDLIYIIIFILGSISGIISFLYLYINYTIFLKNNHFKIKNIYFLYFEKMAILCMHTLFLHSCYDDQFKSQSSFRLAFAVAFEIVTFFYYELSLFIINFFNLCIFESLGQIPFNGCTGFINFIKLIGYIGVEIFLSTLYSVYKLKELYYIFLFIRIIFMGISLIFLYKTIKIINNS